MSLVTAVATMATLVFQYEKGWLVTFAYRAAPYSLHGQVIALSRHVFQLDIVPTEDVNELIVFMGYHLIALEQQNSYSEHISTDRNTNIQTRGYL